MARKQVNSLLVSDLNYNAVPQFYNENTKEFEHISNLNPLPIRISSDNTQIGYSTEGKPEGRKGDSFLELDTKNVYIHDGNDWVIF